MSPEVDDLDASFVSVEEVEAQPQRSLFEKFQRQRQRIGARGAETLIGLPGDLIQLTRSVGDVLGTRKSEEEMNVLDKTIRNLADLFPTSEDLRAFSAEKFPELEPESRFEEFEDELVSDFSALALPVKGRIPFARALGISAVGNIGKEALKDLGFSETTQDLSKIGLMLFSGMFGKGRGVRNHINKLYKNAEQFVPEGAVIPYPTEKLRSVENLLEKGAMNDAKQSVMNIIEDIRFKTPTGAMTVEEAIQFDKDINRAISRSGSDKTKMGYLKQLKKAHSSALDTYAKQNPSWGENYREAKQAFKGIEQSLKVQDFIKRNANLKNLAHGGILLGLAESAVPGRVGMKLGAVGTGAAALYSAEMAKRLATNPALRKYYANVVKASLNENKVSLSRNLAGLERAAKKEFEKNPLPVFEIEDTEEDQSF